MKLTLKRHANGDCHEGCYFFTLSEDCIACVAAGETKEYVLRPALVASAYDAVVEAARGFFNFAEETYATNDKGRKVCMTGWGHDLEEALAALDEVRDE